MSRYSKARKRNNSVVEYRRHLVAKLRARGYSIREIQAALANPASGFLNPDTGAPWGFGTISRDCKAILEQWRREASQEISDYVAMELAELREARRSAWAAGDLGEVRRLLEFESILLGTRRPAEAEKDNEIILRIVYGDATGGSDES